MSKTKFWILMLSVLLLAALPFAAAKVKYPKTAVCPMDGTTAKATGKPEPTLDPQCVTVKYKHKWTDYSKPLHPQQMQHEFTLTVCADASGANPTTSH